MNDRTFSSSQAHRLDSAERKEWLPMAEVLNRLELCSGWRVADVGAGTGYFSIPIAAEIGANGTVYAVDIQPEMLMFIQEKLQATGLKNVECSVGEALATGLTESSCDLVIMSYIWHELDDVDKVLAEANRILKGGGTIAIIDWKPGVQQPPGPPLEHRIPQDQVIGALDRARFNVTAAKDIGPFAYMIVARSISE